MNKNILLGILATQLVSLAANAAVIDLQPTLSNGWTGSGTANISTADGGTLNVGYLDGAVSNASTLNLMPQINLGGGAKGFTFNGTEPGWSASFVGFQVDPFASPASVGVGTGTYSMTRARDNGPGTTTFFLYTTGITGSLAFDISAYGFAGNNFQFGVFSLVDNVYLGSGTVTGAQQLLVSDLSVSTGDQYLVAYSSTGGNADGPFGGTITTTAVPEPGTYAFLGLGGLALMLVRRKSLSRLA